MFTEATVQVKLDARIDVGIAETNGSSIDNRARCQVEDDEGSRRGRYGLNRGAPGG